MGVGSTGVAAVDTARNFLGVELERKYFKAAAERLASTTPAGLQIIPLGEDVSGTVLKRAA